MIIHRDALRALPLLAVALSVSTFFPATALAGATVEMTDECPPIEDRSDEDCTKIGSYEEFRELIQTNKPEGELVLCPFDVQLSPDDKATWIKTDLHLICQQMGKCTLRDGDYHLKVHGSNQVTVQGFNFVGASHSAFRVWEKTQNVQKVCHCSFERYVHWTSTRAAFRYLFLYFVPTFCIYLLLVASYDSIDLT